MNQVKYPNPIDLNTIPGCWLWIGPLDAYSHPVATGGDFPFDQDIHPGRTYRVQHIVFKKEYGYDPKRIGNTCGQPTCIRPDHLFDKAKTKKENLKLGNLITLKSRINEIGLLISQLPDSSDKDVEEYRTSLIRERVEKENEVILIESPQQPTKTEEQNG